MKTDRIWITGASRGIGYETALRLSQSGNRVFMSSRNKTAALIRNITDKFQNSEFINCDVSDSEQVKLAYSLIDDKVGGIDILINNAGIVKYNTLVETTEDEFDKMISTNFKGAYLTIKSVLPAMLKQKRGLIINISSVAALSRFRDSSIYSASKSALLTMSRILREEVRNSGIKVVDILPGATDTAMWDLKSRKDYGSKMMKPADIANIILKTIELNKDKRIITEELIIRPIGGDL